MNLVERLKSDYLVAFKERRNLEKTFLSTVRGEIQNKEKNSKSELSDNDIIKILQKFEKSVKENISKGSKDAYLELEILNRYLPKSLSEYEIRIKIEELVSNGAKNIGDVMKAFSGLPADKSIVSKIYKETLNN
jgi:uncharacterized protein YqeY